MDTRHTEIQLRSNDTCADHEQERHALNFAFSELGLCWHWDEATYRSLQGAGAEGERLRRYLESQHGHLLKAYDSDFLIQAISTTKQRYFEGALAGAQAQA